jgi:hypothetical protein
MSEVCEAQHPTPGVDVQCELEPGPNARTDDVYQTDENGHPVLDDAGNPIVDTPGHDVHVHSGHAEDGSSHNWEDLPT